MKIPETEWKNLRLDVECLHGMCLLHVGSRPFLMLIESCTFMHIATANAELWLTRSGGAERGGQLLLNAKKVWFSAALSLKVLVSVLPQIKLPSRANLDTCKD